MTAQGKRASGRASSWARSTPRCRSPLGAKKTRQRLGHVAVAWCARLLSPRWASWRFRRVPHPGRPSSPTRGWGLSSLAPLGLEAPNQTGQPTPEERFGSNRTPAIRHGCIPLWTPEQTPCGRAGFTSQPAVDIEDVEPPLGGNRPDVRVRRGIVAFGPHGLRATDHGAAHALDQPFLGADQRGMAPRPAWASSTASRPCGEWPQADRPPRACRARVGPRQRFFSVNDKPVPPTLRKRLSRAGFVVIALR